MIPSDDWHSLVLVLVLNNKENKIVRSELYIVWRMIKEINLLDSFISKLFCIY